MSSWMDAFMRDYDASASNYNATGQSQANPTAVMGGTVGDVHVSNSQSNDTQQTADADSGGFGHGLRGFDLGHGFGGDADASNGNLTIQTQANPTAVIGGHVGDVDVTNTQTNDTHQSADANSSGFGHGFLGFGGDADASNLNLTIQTQANPTVILGDKIGDVDVTNTQTNDTYQSADAHASHGFPSFDFGHGLDLGHIIPA